VSPRRDTTHRRAGTKVHTVYNVRNAQIKGDTAISCRVVAENTNHCATQHSASKYNIAIEARTHDQTNNWKTGIAAKRNCNTSCKAKTRPRAQCTACIAIALALSRACNLEPSLPCQAYPLLCVCAIGPYLQPSSALSGELKTGALTHDDTLEWSPAGWPKTRARFPDE